MGPYGPGGYELILQLATPRTTFYVSLAPLSWGLLFSVERGNAADFAMLQIGPLKFVAQTAIWNTSDDA